MRAQQDEAKRLRIRDATLVDGFSRRDRDPTFGMPCLLAQTKKLVELPDRRAAASMPARRSTLLGPEVEGGPGTVTPGPSTFFALNLGSAVPPVGTSILATFVDNRWVFRYDG